jgi:hypothetical protein
MLLSRSIATRVNTCVVSSTSLPIKRAYASVHQGTVVGRPPQAPKRHPSAKSDSDLGSQILSALPRTQKSLPELIEEYNERSGHVLGTSLPYESRPSRERRVNFDDDGMVAMIAHCAQRGDDHTLTTCSGFALEGSNGQSYLLTCAHTLDEVKSGWLSFQISNRRVGR